MVEYIYDAIKAVAGQDAEITAIIKAEDGSYITEGCCFMLHEKNGDVITKVDGDCIDNLWHFVVPAADTEGKKGRYYYCIGNGDGNMCFLKPFYLW